MRIANTFHGSISVSRRTSATEPSASIEPLFKMVVRFSWVRILTIMVGFDFDRPRDPDSSQLRPAPSWEHPDSQ